MDWATGLNNPGELTFSLNQGVSITNEGNWRLPIAGDNPSLGPNQISSEMGHLHYISLENSSGLGAFTNSGPFENLHSFYPISYYWTSTEYAPISDYYAWCFQFEYGNTGLGSKLGVGYSIAVLPADVAIVPIPSAILVLGCGLIGLVGLKKWRE